MASFRIALIATFLMSYMWVVAETQIASTSSDFSLTPLLLSSADGSTTDATEAPGTENTSDGSSLITETTWTDTLPTDSMNSSPTPTPLLSQTRSDSNVADIDSTSPLPTSANNGSFITVTFGDNSTITVTTIWADSNSTGYNATNQTSPGPILSTISAIPTRNTTNGTSTMQPNTTENNISTSVSPTAVFTTSSSYNGTTINTTSLNEKGPHQVNNKTNGGVMFGIILGSTLAILSAMLLVYVLCKRKKSDHFSHRRMYDNLPSDPVLRLDNTTDTIDLRYQGGAAYYNPAVMNEVSPHHPGQLENVNDVIQMDYITPSHGEVA
uniref:Mucin-15-like protein n=1 Tax=Callorhinchus milii TaxID=7868 RepID=V9KQU5_CALMI